MHNYINEKMEKYGEVENACGCPSTNHENYSIPPNRSEKLSGKKAPESPKYFQEIGAEMIGNRLTIRVEKDKNKSKRKGQWDPPCDCEIPEIRLGSKDEEPKIVNFGDKNQILFRIRSGTLVGKDVQEARYKPEAFAYQLSAGKAQKDPKDQSRAITVHAPLGDSTQSQHVHSDHISDGNQDIYLLRINKKSDRPEQKKRNVELEVRTTKSPNPRPI